MFYILLSSAQEQRRVLEGMNKRGVNAVFHYQPLHSSPAGQVYGRAHGALKVTDDISSRLVRLPLFADLTTEQVDNICSLLEQLIEKKRAVEKI